MNIISAQKLPETIIPIVIIGAGGIVKEAHLPAYKKAGFTVLGIYDINKENATALSKAFNIKNVCTTIEEIITLGTEHKAIFDIAVPASKIAEILKQLPNKSAVLIQKPMGEQLQDATKIAAICTFNHLTSAVNFQLRFAPFVNAARSIINQGIIGDFYDMEVKLCTYTPWQLWDFLADLPRVEILYHSIHYIDAIRSFLGEPKGIMAKTVKHPDSKVSSTRSNIIFDYGTTRSASIATNHDHNFGKKHQQSYIKWEGTKGVIIAKMGLNLDYPNGVPDTFEYCVLDEQGTTIWKTHSIEESWFPDAFIGSMSSLMRYLEGSEDTLPTTTQDALKTMKLVEAAYESSQNGIKKYLIKTNTMNFKTQYFEDYQLDFQRDTLGRTITETDIVMHAGQTGDFFPHHMDAEWCKTQDFKQRIAHGTLTFSIAIGMTATEINPVAFSKGYDRLRFVKPVFIGDTIHVEITISDKSDAKKPELGQVTEHVKVLNQHKDVVMVCDHILLVKRK